ncbi:MAG: hypothetical protein KatS3mg108_0213 [Isosphaeraceae bacterium]|jgi:hypothetical protein|nr:MAG: hypothetical protein KatS3mg108_0213 [Isosphaeraceae bacterium]
MGHSEMLLAVAGLGAAELDQRTRTLASGDWSTLDPSDRYAFALAKRLAKEPWSMTEADWRGLVAHYGLERAIDVLWWNARCHYMTRVADAFQIPLERENVFAPLADRPGIGPVK